MPETNTTEVVEPIKAPVTTENAVLPELNQNKIAEIVSNNTVVIDEKMKQAQVNAQQVQEFLETNLKTIFDSQNQTVTAIWELFRKVVDIDEIKNSLKDMINTFAIEKTDIIWQTITTVDDNLKDINPFVKTVRNSIENGVSFWHKMLWGSAKKEISEALQWLAGRVESLSNTFNEAKLSLDKNEVLLTQLVPKVWYRIAKLEGMSKALTTINTSITHEPTKQMISSLISEFTNLAVLQRDSLTRLMLLTVMNWNSKLVLQATEVEVFVSLEPLIWENIIGWEQVKIYELRSKVRSWLDALRNNSISNIDKIMAMSEQAKVDLKISMEQAAQRIETMIAKANQHEKNLAVAQKAIDDYAPILQQTVDNLDTKIKDYALSQKNSAEATANIMKSMSDETAELKTLAKV